MGCSYLLYALIYCHYFHTLCIALDSSKNVALKSEGATCEANPQYIDVGQQWKQCTGAIDGSISSSTPYRWAFLGNPINSWIQINFNQLYFISNAEIIPLYNREDRTFKDVEFQFSTQTSQFVQANTPGPVKFTFTSSDERGILEKITFSPARQARSIRMVTKTSYRATDLDKAYNGLIELRYFTGPPPDPTTTTRTTTTTTTPTPPPTPAPTPSPTHPPTTTASATSSTTASSSTPALTTSKSTAKPPDTPATTTTTSSSSTAKTTTTTKNTKSAASYRWFGIGVEPSYLIYAFIGVSVAGVFIIGIGLVIYELIRCREAMSNEGLSQDDGQERPMMGTIESASGSAHLTRNKEGTARPDSGASFINFDDEYVNTKNVEQLPTT